MLTAPAGLAADRLWVVSRVLIVRVSVNGGHQPADDLEVVVEHLDHRDEAVWCHEAFETSVLLGSLLVVVDAITKVASASDEGAEMMTRSPSRAGAPPHRRAR